MIPLSENSKEQLMFAPAPPFLPPIPLMLDVIEAAKSI